LFPGIPATGMFFFSSWLTMIFWGIVAPDIGIRTISYTTAMVVTIALWLIVGPVVLIIARKTSYSFVKWDVRRPNDQFPT